jgi:TctA family transporter
MSRGDVLEMLSRPLTLTLLLLGLAAVVAPVVTRWVRGRAISAAPAQSAR